MPNSPVMSKIRCFHPNKKSSRISNRNHVIYIGTREGVDLSPLPSADAPNDTYLDYIANRPHSNGLFGNIDCADEKILGNRISKYTEEGKNIYRGIVSLTEADAIALGYDKKEQWVSLLNKTMPDISLQFHIPVDKLQWIGAVHMEQGHPHCHYMFWHSGAKVQSPYIHVSVQHKCREILSKELYQEERLMNTIDKTLARDAILELNKELLKDELNYLLKRESRIPEHIHSDDLNNISKSLLKLAQSLPTSGRLSYKLLPPALKEEVNIITKACLNLPALKKEYHSYQDSIAIIAKTYSTTESKSELISKNALDDLHKRLGNQILKTAKELLLSISSESLAYNEDRMPGSDFSSESFDYLVSSADFYEYTPPDDIPDYIQMDYSINEPSIHWENSIDNYELDIPDGNSSNYKNTYQLGKLYADPTSDVFDLNKAISYFQKENSTYSYYALGKIYLDTKYDTFDRNHGIELMEKAAALENSFALYSLGTIYTDFSDDKLPMDLDKGILYLNKAIELQNKHASIALGSLYTHPDSPVFDFDKGFQILEQEANSGNPMAHYTLGNVFTNSFAEQKPLDLERGIQYFEKAIALDNKQALYSLGKILVNQDSSVFDLARGIDLLEQATLCKNPWAFYSLGKLYSDFSDDKPPMDLDKGILYLNKAIELQNKHASIALGSLYTHPDSPVFDFDKGFQILEQEANAGNPMAHYTLGNVFTNSSAEQKPLDLERGIQYFEKAIALENKQALYSLGKILINQDSSVFDLDRGIDLLEQATLCKNPWAFYSLGKLYSDFSDDKPPMDLDKGILYLNKAIELQNKHASIALGSLYTHPDSPVFDFDKGFQILEQEANSGNSMAHYTLGNVFTNSSAEQKPLDLERGIQYFEKAIALDNKQALYSLGKILVNQDSSVFDLDRGIDLLEQAAAQQNEYALYSLGKVYSNVDLKEYNITKAVQYFQQAADQNNSFAQLQLGCIHLWGKHKGIPQDFELGMKWLNLSIQNQNDFAKEIIDTYNTHQLNMTLSMSYKLISNIFSSLNQDTKMNTAANTLKKYSHEHMKAESKKSSPHHSHNQ